MAMSHPCRWRSRSFRNFQYSIARVRLRPPSHHEKNGGCVRNMKPRDPVRLLESCKRGLSVEAVGRLFLISLSNFTLTFDLLVCRYNVLSPSRVVSPSATRWVRLVTTACTTTRTPSMKLSLRSPRTGRTRASCRTSCTLIIAPSRYVGFTVYSMHGDSSPSKSRLNAPGRSPTV